MDNTKKIILPGGAGLVGQNLAIHLKNRGYNNLVILDKHKKNLAIMRQLHPELTIEYADLAEPGAWYEHFNGADGVVMLQAQIGDLQRDPFVRNNITSTERVLEAVKEYRVPYVIHISSSVVESVANDYYTETKKLQEQIVIASGVDYVVLRPTLMFGWFDRKHLGWLSRFMRRVPIFPIPGHGKYMRQPLYAGDFANIIVSCLESRIKSKIFNISGLEKIDYIDIIKSIKKTTRSKTWILKIPYSLFYFLLYTWSIFDKQPPFTVEQLKALTAHDEFEVIDWPKIFDITPTPFQEAIEQTFAHPEFTKIVLEF